MGNHDQSYKQLFSNFELVRDLLFGFVKEDWVRELDIDTLERVNGSYVSDDLREREDDIIWRVRLGGSWVYVYLLIEFQSTVDRYMALRLLVYLGLLYQDLQKSGNLLANGKLPPVLPLVLYNGKKKWNAAIDISELIQEIPGGLGKYRPIFQYFLLEENSYPENNLPKNNFVSAVFQLEKSQYPEDIRKVVKTLIQWLKSPEQTSVRRAFAVWINRVLLPAHLPGQDIPIITDLLEVETMLAERVKEWTREWKEEGLQQGMQQGMQKGGEQILHQLLLEKFGEIAPEFELKLQNASNEQILKWASRVLTANSLADIFKN